MSQQTETIFVVCSLSGNNYGEGSPGCTLANLVDTWQQKWPNPCASTGIGKQSNYNRHCEILVTNDPWSPTTQAPVGKGAGLRSGIRNQIGMLKQPHD